ncbi:hypothetical protein B5G50_15570 [Brevibacillus brevis]|uniref:hypothetical protein n=1 Tax=Brevibacillus brevis TaxID=1393 RepID=UPI000B36DF3F|nr:hypothetical protein [Brevibacillus brevis]OUQ87430.1 hypothetical protein B5G50_15570 [Brevibacillus brevis]
MDVTVIHADGLEVTGSINGDTKELGSAPVRFDGLEVEKEYVLTVVVTDGDRSKEKQVKIVIPVSEEEAFKQKASQFVRDITLISDGEVNSGKVWILVTAPDSLYKERLLWRKDRKSWQMVKRDSMTWVIIQPIRFPSRSQMVLTLTRGNVTLLLQTEQLPRLKMSRYRQ